MIYVAPKKDHIVGLIGKMLLVVVLSMTIALCFGCSSTSSANQTGGSGAAHPKEFYEGYWTCCGYQKNGTTVSFDKLTPEDKKSFPYLGMELEQGRLATVIQLNNDSAAPENLLMGEWSTTSTGISIDGVKFVLDGERLTSQQDDLLLYFERCVFGSGLHVGTIEFEGITFDAPIDLVYAHDGASPGHSNYNIVDSYRSNGPTLMMSSRPAEVQDITEMADFYAGYEDCFTSYNGMNYFVRNDMENHSSNVAFVNGGKWYDIDFRYSAEDFVDYTEYAETFYTTIGDGSESAADGGAEAESESQVPPGAVSWQEASQHIGETVSVYGPVVDATYSATSNNQPTFINIGAAYPDENRVTAVVWGEDRGAFPQPPETMYEGKTVCVTGEVYVYSGACNIKVTSPSQISIL